jgi:hypothetical protein
LLKKGIYTFSVLADCCELFGKVLGHHVV